ncbi:metalloregulator ArsR/SmtB family transcription factor [Gilvimarinus sp. 1_MG-2023]|uniref:metalloregulator ArsR/SmtB family transcription factor n=1 Tax=Gilvimarinus sp. 1_MG-2023 TaxID=3062638 RepID=UPI0026E267DC|nr:metalloregulator ArsR/SmtB family transcription factor [Gilvimarinus sp. 1_MG-2023]MDO6746603.1 metalloregulator ArsR/SmtB family transcription factor [Gilvimarinus sp. 1_MG-2023]
MYSVGLMEWMRMNPVDFYKCLAEPTRLQCLLLIERLGELCVCELTTATQLSQPKVSRHLAQLRECGLLLSSKRGQWVYYRLAPALPDWIKSVLAQTLQGNGAWLSEPLARLDKMPGRPPCCV